MLEQLKDLLKAAKTKQDALEVLHIEAQNVKIQLFNRNYKVITIPGEPGPSFDEELDENQKIDPQDEDLVEYFKTVRALKKAVDDVQLSKSRYTTDPLQAEFINIIESKPE